MNDKNYDALEDERDRLVDKVNTLEGTIKEKDRLIKVKDRIISDLEWAVKHHSDTSICCMARFDEIKKLLAEEKVDEARDVLMLPLAPVKKPKEDKANVKRVGKK